jgi:acyl-CoA thioesterase-1
LVVGGKLNRKMKLLALAFAVLIFLVSIESFVLVTMENKSSEARPIRVACIGDSITRGTQYTIDLWDLLGSNYVVGDFGIGGATVYLDSNASYLNQTGFEVAKQFEPNIVIIMLGTNDASTNLTESNPAFVSDYIKLVTEFQSLASKPEVWIVVPPPIFNNSANLNEDYFVQNIVPNIKQVASQMNLPLIDVFTPLVNHPECFVDGVHPNVDGARTIANVIHSALVSTK